MHCWQRLCIRGHRVVRITPCPPGGDPGAPGPLGGECLLHEDHASRPLLRPVSRGQTSPVCCIQRLPANLSICGQQPSLARQVVPVLFPDGAVSVFLLHFSRGVLQEGPFFSPGCVLPFLRVSVGTVAGVLARCYWWYPFTCTVYVDAPDSARGPLAEDPVRPAQSDVRLGVLSSSSETCPGAAGVLLAGLRRERVRAQTPQCRGRPHWHCTPCRPLPVGTGRSPALGLGVHAGWAQSCRAVSGPRWGGASEERRLGAPSRRGGARAHPLGSVLSSGSRPGPSGRGCHMPFL